MGVGPRRLAGVLQPSLLVLALIFSLLRPAVVVADSSAAADGRLNEDLASQFLRNPKRAYAMRVAKKANRPLMVILTQRNCAACHNLLQSINAGTELHYLLPRFVAVHADTQKGWKAWQLAGHDYMPQTLFFAPGEKNLLPILGTSDESPHFLHDADTVVWGMTTCLEAVASGARWNTTGTEEQARQDAIDKLGWSTGAGGGEESQQEGLVGGGEL
jgi:hypothetical protein